MSFSDRQTAGHQLAERIVRYFHRAGLKTGHNIVVVGLPRGGVPVALEVARLMECQLDIIVSKKLPYPGQPEFAIGAVSSDGIVVLNPDIPDKIEWQNYVEQERQRLLVQTVNIENRLYELSGRKRSTNYKDKVVIVVDDGVATGMTAIAALDTARHRGAGIVIAAAPVMSCESYRELGRHCDGVVACDVPEVFRSVGQHYENFEQTTDDEVVAALRGIVEYDAHQAGSFLALSEH